MLQVMVDDGEYSKSLVLRKEGTEKRVSLHCKKKKRNLITSASNNVSATMHVTVRVTFCHQCCFFQPPQRTFRFSLERLIAYIL